ncbi:FAD dependent oxidoreductase [Phytophthora infestans]|nr:FAD dependent oxidoreductase [Phytophthora infestans]
MTAGGIGLTTALALLQSGFKHVRVVADKFDATTSHVTGGLWVSFALPDGIDTSRPRKWCAVTYTWLDTLRKEKGERLGIHIVPGVDMSARWSAANDEPFMLWLHEEVAKQGGTFEQRRVISLDEEQCDLLVNCSGLAAKELAGYDTVFPFRCQIINVFHSKPNEPKVSVDKDGQHAYIIPRPDGDVVLGETVQEHNWSTKNKDDDVDGVWERCCRLWPEVRNSKVIDKMAGLRPGRTGGVRLEMQATATKQKAVVVHNYGHEGSGHTLHWSCAQDVAKLAKQRFKLKAENVLR